MNPKIILQPFLLLLVTGSLVQATPPAWWSDGNPPIINENEQNNNGPVMVGQAKWMVSEALRSLDAVSPDIAAEVLQDLDSIVDLSIPNPKTEEWIEEQKAALLIGQLKALSAPFYTRINAFDAFWLTEQRVANGTQYTGSIFPWTATLNDDQNNAIANIGQLKAVFSLPFETLSDDLDGDGIPNDEDQFPNDYYNDTEHLVTIVSGNDQSYTTGVIGEEPIIIEVTDEDGSHLVNAPVSITANEAFPNGLFSLNEDGSESENELLNVRTDENGQILIWYTPFG